MLLNSRGLSLSSLLFFFPSLPGSVGRPRSIADNLLDLPFQARRALFFSTSFSSSCRVDHEL